MDRLDFKDDGVENRNEAELSEASRKDGGHSVLSDFWGTLGLPGYQAGKGPMPAHHPSIPDLPSEFPLDRRKK
jgi:hypothetical protein